MTNRSGRNKNLEARQRVFEVLRSGEYRYRVIAEQAGVSEGFVGIVFRECGGVVPKFKVVNRRYLSLDDRIRIASGIDLEESDAEIAEAIGKCRQTVWREIRRNGGRDHYQVLLAVSRAEDEAKRPKVAKLVRCFRLRQEVQRQLLKRLSPRQVALRLMVDFPGDPEMKISHEAIYQSLFIQGRGALRRELTSCLRSGRAMRRPQRREAKGRIPNMVMISERPAEINDRAVPGHWEGDLIIGKDGKSQIGTLVERQTRYVMLMKLSDKRAETVRTALERTVQRMPEELFMSLTWDQGVEMAQHQQFSVATGVAVYFCDPHSPWQRGSNENTNGLLRQYFPKGTPLGDYTQRQLDKVARELNERPRETLGWQTPAEKLAELLQ